MYRARKPPKKQVEKYQCKDKNVMKLINHPNNNYVKYDGRHIIYRDSDGKIACDRGLTTLLSIFFDGYKRPSLSDIKTHCKLNGLRFIKSKKNVIKIGDPWEKVDMIRNNSNKTGRTLGTLVHEELCLFARCKTKEDYEKVCPNPHDYTKRVILELNRRGITLFFAEFSIVDPMVKYVTPIDLVGINKDGKLTIIEVKTGYDNIFTIGNVQMKKPFESWINSPLNQARIQLLIPCLTLKYRYGVNVNSAWVLNVNSAHVKMYPLLTDMTKNSEVLYNHLIDNYGIKHYNNSKKPIKKRKREYTPKVSLEKKPLRKRRMKRKLRYTRRKKSSK